MNNYSYWEKTGMINYDTIFLGCNIFNIVAANCLFARNKKERICILEKQIPSFVNIQSAQKILEIPSLSSLLELIKNDGKEKVIEIVGSKFKKLSNLIKANSQIAQFIKLQKLKSEKPQNLPKNEPESKLLKIFNAILSNELKNLPHQILAEIKRDLFDFNQVLFFDQNGFYEYSLKQFLKSSGRLITGSDVEEVWKGINYQYQVLIKNPLEENNRIMLKCNRLILSLSGSQELILKMDLVILSELGEIMSSHFVNKHSIGSILSLKNTQLESINSNLKNDKNSEKEGNETKETRKIYGTNSFKCFLLNGDDYLAVGKIAEKINQYIGSDQPKL